MTRSEKHPNLSKILIGQNIKPYEPDQKQIRRIIMLLAGSVALMMTGFGIIMPIFARRFSEYGSGVEALGLMTMSFALAQLIAAPFMGTLADRIGRRPLVIVSLLAFGISNIGFIWAPSTLVFIIIRTFEGAFTAGLFPASMGIVADMVPEKKRAQWIGIVMGSYSAGFIFGPAIGGVLYDLHGFKAPFMVSATLGFLAFIAATVLVPETRTADIRKRERLRNLRASQKQENRKESFLTSLPKPRYIFFTLLTLNFIGAFAFAFIEPQMVFYFYDDLGWSTTQFGLVIGVFGLAMVLSQFLLGRSSDRFGRKPVIITGFLLSLSFYFGLIFIKTFALALLVAFVAGLGDALKGPALSAYYLDIASKKNRSQIMGFKESALSMGGVVGPALVAIIGSAVKPQIIFLIAGCTMAFGGLLALVVLREPKTALPDAEDTVWQISEKKQIAAQASMRGVVTWAISRRKDKLNN